MHQGAAVNAKEAIRKLREAGFEEKRHTGSHKHFEHPDFGFSVPVPMHGARDLKNYEEASIRAAIRGAEKMRKESHGNG
ncbi:MAG: type II toxin-antitoxin system HicA family toxin [Armatimonadetes bacterium]|nr:type II toxin-antitoxin system HicA family toxin [Armatimonadota bacterium]